MKKKIIGASLGAALFLGVLATNAFAINDVLVPADECAPTTSSTVGNPEHFGGTNPGIDTHSGPVGRPVSANNPGQSTGAEGQAQSEAPANCT